MKKILTILGARPQFIKAATISRVIQKDYQDSIEEIIIHTGQHYDHNMSEVFFKEMNIPAPKYLLNNMGGKLHGEMTGAMIIELEKIMIQEKPDLVLIYGDTNSTLAGSISAAKLHIPIAHIEAGMRSCNKKMPEEINRIASDHLSSYFFCTTEEPATNLKNENIKDNIFVVGDVMYDAVSYYSNSAKVPDALENFTEEFYLVTCHRQENTDSPQRLNEIFKALRHISQKSGNVLLVLHPRTKKYIKEYNISTEGIIIAAPMSYLEMLYCLKNAKMVMTDSGGLQREAYYLEKPAIIFNDQTEWKELVENGAAILSGANCKNILEAEEHFLSSSYNLKRGIYGDGNAAAKIMQILAKSFC